jgi:shikimate dehydrogenase
VPFAEVIGDPIGHSKSPLIHQYWLSVLGMSGEYRRTEVAPAELAAFLRQRRTDPDWRGCNITVPHKEAVISFLDRLDERAVAVDAINCVVPGPGGLTGYNSDVDGVAAALDGVALEGRKAALIGAGGAARAAVVYLAERKVAEVAVVARNREKAERLQALIPDARLTVGGFDKGGVLFAGSAVVINASPLGMQGFPAMPTELLGAANDPSVMLFDMVYSPVETAFLAGGQGPRVNGLTMLVGQAARAFELFYGAPAPPVDARLLELLGG